MPFVIERKTQGSKRTIVHDNGTCRIVVEGPEHSSADLSYPLYYRVFLEVIDGYDAMREPRWTGALEGSVKIARGGMTRVFDRPRGPAFTGGEATGYAALQGFLREIVNAYLDSLAPDTEDGGERGVGE